jgi:hypothetical protein
MQASSRYLGLSLALGVIAVWASENMFWIVQPDPFDPLDFSMTVLAYAAACGCALSMVIWSGVTGWPAAFLGGAVLGFVVEGTVVGTIYDAFPFQLVWTPLAWHALITGGVVLGLARLGRGPLPMVLVWLAYGAAMTVWATYWPVERLNLPDTQGMLVYLALPAVAVVGAQIAVDRLWPLPRVPRWVLWIAPVLAFALWGIRVAISPENLTYFVLPVLLAGLYLIMQRQARGQVGQSKLVAPPAWQHALILIAPLMVALAAPPLWTQFGAVAVSLPFAITTGVVSLGVLTALAVGVRLSRVQP